MIIVKKHIAAAVLIVLAAAIVFVCIKKHEIRQTFSANNIKIVVDAGHGAID